MGEEHEEHQPAGEDARRNAEAYGDEMEDAEKSAERALDALEGHKDEGK